MHCKAVKDINNTLVNEVCSVVYPVAVYHKAKGRRAREKLPCVAQHTAGGSPVVRPYLGVREGEAKGR